MNNNQTIKNMELALIKIEKEFEESGLQQVKTLINTYRTLLRQVSNSIPNTVEKIPHKDELSNQLEKVLILCDGIDEKIFRELKKENYKSADSLTVSIDRLKKIRYDLQWVLGAESRYASDKTRRKNLPQNRNK